MLLSDHYEIPVLEIVSNKGKGKLGARRGELNWILKWLMREMEGLLGYLRDHSNALLEGLARNVNRIRGWFAYPVPKTDSGTAHFHELLENESRKRVFLELTMTSVYGRLLLDTDRHFAIEQGQGVSNTPLYASNPPELPNFIPRGEPAVWARRGKREKKDAAGNRPRHALLAIHALLFGKKLVSKMDPTTMFKMDLHSGEWQSDA